MRPPEPSALTGDQLSFVAAALLAQTLKKYLQTGVASYLAAAKRHARTALGRDTF